MKFVRKLLGGLKTNVDKGRKKVLKDDRRLKSARFNVRSIFTMVFWIVVFCVIFFSFQSWARTGFLNNKVNDYQKQASAQIASLNEIGFANSPAGEEYTYKFLETYINIPANKEDREKRLKELQGFIAEGLKVEQLENLSDFNGKRELKSATLYEVKDVGGKSASYVYRIEYELFKNVEKKEQVEVKKKDKKGKEKKVKEEKVTQKEESVGTKSHLIVIRVGTDGNSFNVIEQPYYEPLPSESRLTAVQDNADPSKKNPKVEDKLKQFATQFFTSYTTNSIDEMAYLMKKPESLQGLYKYQGLEEFNVYNGNKEGQYIIKTLVLLQQADTGLISKHPFTLVVSKQNDKFFVQELKHTLGGDI